MTTVPLEEPAAISKEKKLPAGANQKKKWSFLVVAVAVVALALGLGLGVGQDRDEHEPKSEGDMAVYSGTQTGTSGAASTPSDPTGVNGATTNTAETEGDNDNNSNIVLLNNGVHLPDVLTTDALRNTQESCEDLLVDLRKVILHTANRTIEQNIQRMFHRPHFLDVGGTLVTGVAEGAVGSAPAMDASAGGAGTAGSTTDRAVKEDSFGTNNQVEGVDEADVLKSNGLQAFAAYGQEIVVLDVDQVTVLSRTTLPATDSSTGDSTCRSVGGSILGMLLIEERLVVVAIESIYCFAYVEGGVEGDMVSSSEATKIHIYDTGTMTLLSTEELGDEYISARSVGNNVYVVTAAFMNTSEFTQYLDPNPDVLGINFTEEQYRTLAQAQAELHVDAFASRLASKLDCETMKQIALFQNTAESLGFSGGMESLVSVHAFDVSDVAATLNTRTMILPSGPWNVYVSKVYLVLARQGYQVYAIERTYLVVYKLDGPSVSDVMVGSVDGYTLNQFSMDQSHQMDPATQTEKDYLRIATCPGQRPADNGWELSEDPLCRVSILEINENMPIVGCLKDVGKPGERISSVRFHGDRGFVVTFLETDPSYTLDLSDPTNPQVKGQLESPGFFNYLHPIGDDLLLGVGLSNIDGNKQGLQVSLFDVGDFANPVRLFNYVDENRAFYDALYDHHSFRYLPESGILILPLSIWGNGVLDIILDGFQLYAIDKSTGIEPYLTIGHGSGNVNDDDGWCSFGRLMPRSLVKKGSLLTFKRETILGYNLSDRTVVGALIHLNHCPPRSPPSYLVGG